MALIYNWNQSIWIDRFFLYLERWSANQFVIDPIILLVLTGAIVDGTTP